MIPNSKDDFLQLQLEMIAKRLAWDDLDKDDQRVYMREAQKKLAKENPWLVEEGLLEVEKKGKKR